MATSIGDLRDRLRDRLGLSKFSELTLDVTVWTGSGSVLKLPLSHEDNVANDDVPSVWDKPDILEAVLERARLLYMGYRGNPSQVDAALGQFFDKEAKHHDSAPHTFDR